MAINRVVISGNLTRDPELRTTQTGTSVLNFTVAVNDRVYNKQSGQWSDYANYIPVTMFGKRAEGIEPYLAKGTKVTVEGKLRWSQWEQDGQKRNKLEVIVDELELMAGKTTPEEPSDEQRWPKPQKQQRWEPNLSDEEIPF